MATSPRIQRRIESIQSELIYIEAWLENNPNGINSYNIGSRGLSYMNPLQVLALKNKLEDELLALEMPGGRFKRVMPLR